MIPARSPIVDPVRYAALPEHSGDPLRVVRPLPGAPSGHQLNEAAAQEAEVLRVDMREVRAGHLGKKAGRGFHEYSS